MQLIKNSKTCYYYAYNTKLKFIVSDDFYEVTYISYLACNFRLHIAAQILQWQHMSHLSIQ